MKLTLSPRLCARLYPLFPWNRGLLILLAFTTLAAGPGVVLYDADPFLVPTAGVLATFPHRIGPLKRPDFPVD